MKNKSKKNAGKKVPHQVKIKAPDHVLRLLVKAGSRCEFRGCNKYLLDDKFTGFKELNLADVAHIVGRAIDGPRGKHPLPIIERNKAENLMLLCAEHHNKIIDKGKLVSQFPVELLRRYKKEHENRIFQLTAMGPECRTTIIRMLGNIRGDSVSISQDEIREAVFQLGRYPDYLGVENNIEIDLTNLPKKDDGKYWESGVEKINEILDRQIIPAFDKKEITHISIFAFARIPFLLYLGHKLGDKIPTELFQKQRSSGQNWVWEEKGNSISFVSNLVRKGKQKNKVALMLSISGKVKVSDLPSKIGSGFSIYEITPRNVEPGREILKTKISVDSFRLVYEKLLREIERKHTADEIHLFPAIPISAAIVCGKGLLKGISPALLVYDKAKNTYSITIKVKG